jgi:hypothetical protein
MYRQAYNSVTKKFRREAVVKGLFFLPGDKRRQLERWLRGREEYRTLQRADVAVVSCGKSGRTWLRAMLSHFFQMRYSLPGTTLINFDNFHYRHKDIPRIFFTHDSYLKYYTGHFNSKLDYRPIKTVLLVRNPADVAVSQYFQWQHRIPKHKKWLNEYPTHGAQIAIFDLMMDPKAGLEYVVGFLNDWQQARQTRPDLEVVRYEDMHVDPSGQLQRILLALGFEATAAELEESVAFASFENMRKLEQQGVLWFGGRSMRKPTGGDENSFKVRRGRAGGWRDYFTGQQVDAIQSYIEDHLKPGFGYLASEPRDRMVVAEQSPVAGRVSA